MLVYILKTDCYPESDCIYNVFVDLELAKTFLMRKTFGEETIGYQHYYLKVIQVTTNNSVDIKDYNNFSFITNGNKIFSSFISNEICKKIYNEYPVTETLDKLNVLVNEYTKSMYFMELKKHSIYETPGTGLILLELETQQDNLDINLQKDIEKLL